MARWSTAEQGRIGQVQRFTVWRSMERLFAAGKVREGQEWQISAFFGKPHRDEALRGKAWLGEAGVARFVSALHVT